MTSDLHTKLNLANDQQASPTEASDSEAIEQIRSLLFGEQLSKLSVRLNDIEALVAQQIGQLTEFVETRLEALSQEIREVDQNTYNRVETEQTILQSGIDSVNHQLEQVAGQMNGALAALKTAQTEEIDAVNQKLVGQRDEAQQDAARRDQQLARLFHELGNRLSPSDVTPGSD